MSIFHEHDFSAIMQGAKTAAIAGHIHPDGDCVGSCLGFLLYLQEQFPDVKIDLLLETFPDSFRILPGIGQVKHTCCADTVYDVFFCLDCGDRRRLGDFAVCFDKAAYTVCIDHHISNQAFASENFIDPQASSTSELICDLTGMDHITRDMAQALYMGIIHDTGMFQYSCTSPHTMTVAAQLMEKGAAHTQIAAETFFSRSAVQSRLLGKALSSYKALCGGKILYYVLTKKELEELGGTVLDLDGISAQMKLTEGSVAVLFLYETEEQVYKVSMRSNEQADVSVAAVRFGGGGHKRAAGATIHGTASDVIQGLVDVIRPQLED
ncbi:MAG: bifunctional oligoribonuclease/PAP phosphatase NrnA [Lachnospiraceae bacterium]|nr:bifunctional oligoribonuclease/PAP phosphatase NrnA [Lachnospiraceae bacterium]